MSPPTHYQGSNPIEVGIHMPIHALKNDGDLNTWYEANKVVLDDLMRGWNTRVKHLFTELLAQTHMMSHDRHGAIRHAHDRLKAKRSSIASTIPGINPPYYPPKLVEYVMDAAGFSFDFKPNGFIKAVYDRRFDTVYIQEDDGTVRTSKIKEYVESLGE